MKRRLGKAWFVAAIGWTLLFRGTAGAAEVKGDWQADWEKTLQAGKAEGRVVLYAYNQYDEFFREFEKKFPEIKVSAVMAHGYRCAFSQCAGAWPVLAGDPPGRTGTSPAYVVLS